ncbi:hypothetical protein C8F04DRAFT_1394598 [Mycena alexandri]|uniref:Uncharacterized protein n=1 Tax=Mycena alexandri TaxID=1745969 RepID=A0AAD6SY55_9AGAR|nr:hypothetical protein C8F04DRAFT_1394598 [Mycena alexandri]
MFPWTDNLFKVHIFDNQLPYSSRSLLTTFRDVLSVLAHRTPGPVIVVAEKFIHKLQPKDILHWQLRDWEEAYGRLGRYRSKIGFSAKKYSYFSIPLRGHPSNSFQLGHIHTVNVRSIRTQSETLSHFTLMAFPTSILRLAPTEALPAAALSTILPHIIAPYLRLLNFFTDAIDPAALSEFVGRHKGITDIRFNRDADDGWSFTKAKILCRPPIILPRLTTLEASDGFRLVDLLDAFDSPSVSTLGISSPRQTAAHIVGLKLALRRISLRARPTTLVLSLYVVQWRRRAATIPIDEEEQTIVGTAYCIECVRLLNSTFHEARRLLPWLAMLPALRRVEFGSVIHGSSWTADDQTQLDDFVRDAQAALPSVIELDVERRRP